MADRIELLIGPRQFQKYLQYRGLYNGAIDGIIGPQSLAAVHSLLANAEAWNTQRKFNAVVQLLLNDLGIYTGTIDGIVGPLTRAALTEYSALVDFTTDDNRPASVLTSFTGRGERLGDVELGVIAQSIGVGEDELHAVIDVETPGNGFDEKGRPRMLFEPHIFYRELAGEERQRAIEAGLAYPKWKRSYPKDSYPRLQRAMEINREAAFRSASWGIGQVMGFNHKLADYPTAEAMVIDFVDSENAQLQGMVNFIRNAGLADELQRHDWAGFARGYNGAGYKNNDYDTKLAKRFAFWKNIPDTPIPDHLRL